MYAVIATGGKQYKVSEGDTIFIEKLEIEAEGDVTFDQVMAIGKDDGMVVGTPTVAGAKVEGKVMKQGKGKKIRIFKLRSKKNSRTRQGHRQPYTKVQITAIIG